MPFGFVLVKKPQRNLVTSVSPSEDEVSHFQVSQLAKPSSGSIPGADTKGRWDCL